MVALATAKGKIKVYYPEDDLTPGEAKAIVREIEEAIEEAEKYTPPFEPGDMLFDRETQEWFLVGSNYDYAPSRAEPKIWRLYKSLVGQPPRPTHGPLAYWRELGGYDLEKYDPVHGW